jgi:flagellar hook assembly protein FlgD
VKYKLSELSEGPHTLTLKAWDINGNSSTSVTDFVVSNSSTLALDRVLNYPNPFSTNTSFYFEHNKPCTGMTIQVQIFTVSGKLIRTLSDYQICDGYRNNPLTWDGKDDFGDKIGQGAYIYRLKIRTADGETAEKIEKLVILR